MASSKKNPTTPKADNTGKLAVVASNIEEEKKSTNVGGDTVTVACHLPFGLKFDDVPDGDGTKTIIFPGINEHARGAEAGILLGVGKSVAVILKRCDWEAIVRMHGKERAFNSYNGNPPCLMVIKDTSAMQGDEVKAQKHGLEPIDPKAVNVVEKAKA